MADGVHLHLHQPWAKCGLSAAAALRSFFCGLIAAFCLYKFAKKLLAHTVTFPTADESPGKNLQRA